MTYPALTAVVVAGAIVAAVALGAIARRRGASWSRLLVPPAASLAVLLVLTAVFDNVIIGTGLVAYDESRISGLAIGVAPLEDFAYPLVGALLLPLVQLLLAGRADPASDAPVSGEAPGGANASGSPETAG